MSPSDPDLTLESWNAVEQAIDRITSSNSGCSLLTQSRTHEILSQHVASSLRFQAGPRKDTGVRSAFGGALPRSRCSATAMSYICLRRAGRLTSNISIMPPVQTFPLICWISCRETLFDRWPRRTFGTYDRHRINTNLITDNWDDVLRLAGSLKLGVVQATSIMRTLRIDDRPTKLAQAVAEPGRIDKSIHSLTYVDDESKRRRTLTQLNRGEDRHKLGRAVFHGKRGELRQRYQEGQEDQLGALGLVVNIIVLWNTLYIERLSSNSAPRDFPCSRKMSARLSPLIYEHINLLGRYAFSVPEAVQRGELRPLRSPSDSTEEVA